MRLSAKELEVIAEGIELYIGLHSIELRNEEIQQHRLLKARIEKHASELRFGRVLVESEVEHGE